MALSKDQDGGYWYNSNTVPQIDEDFFEENSVISRPARLTVIEGGAEGGSILDNITTGEGAPTQSQTGAVLSPSGLTRGVGRSLGSLGEKINDWRPAASVKKWSQGGGGERCSNCPRLEKEVAQLSARLQASYSRVNVPLPVSATVHAMLQGLPYSLQPYVSLQAKKDLLQAALQTADSDTIIAVLVFCKNTLSKRLFLKELERSPAAVTPYVNYLKRRRHTTEVVDLLTSLGRREEAGLIRYRQCLATTDHKSRVLQLNQMLSTHFTEASSLSVHYQRMLHDHITLLEQQHSLDRQDSGNNNTGALVAYPRASSVYDRPLLTTLYYCSMYHWEVQPTPLTLKMHYRLSDRQYLWCVLKGRARVRHYHLPHQLANLLQNKGGVLGALGGALSAVGASLGAPLKAVLPLDRVVDVLKGADAPDAVLSAYLALVEPRELRLKLSLQHNVRSAAVDAYVSLKDKDGLQRYMTSNLPPGSADFVKADAALKTGRWR